MHQWILKGHIHSTSLGYLDRLMGADEKPNEVMTRFKADKLILEGYSKKELCDRFGLTTYQLNNKLLDMYYTSVIDKVKIKLESPTKHTFARESIPPRMLEAILTCNTNIEVAAKLRKSARQTRRDMENLFGTTRVSIARGLIGE
jgi:hypothetical protein